MLIHRGYLGTAERENLKTDNFYDKNSVKTKMVHILYYNIYHSRTIDKFNTQILVTEAI
jgi:hypothetical protein